MTEDITPEQQKIISQAWHQFLIDTTKYDSDHDKPNGWCWFWCLYDIYNNSYELPNLDLATIQSKLHNQHWLKITNDKIQEACDIINGDNTKGDSKFLDSGLILLHNLEKANLPKFPKIDFSGLSFNDKMDFSDFIFPVDTDFGSTTFSKQAFFINAVFLSITNFYDTKFSAETYFTNALFSRMGNFYMAVFSDNAEFSGVKFSQIAGFRGTKFYELADFSNSKIEGHTNFADAEFKKYTPHFYNATISPDIILETEINFWPQLNEYANILKQTDINEILRINKNAYENLAYHMKKPARYHDEHFFFRQEMRCRRSLEKTPFNSLIFWLYENLADYGYGIDRAFKAWVWHIVYGFIAILAMVTISIIIQSWYGHWQGWINVADTFLCSALVSATNATPYVFIGADNGFLMNCYKGLQSLNPFIFNVIRIVQTVVGVSLLFLFLTTLRVRFRIK